MAVFLNLHLKLPIQNSLKIEVHSFGRLAIWQIVYENSHKNDNSKTIFENVFSVYPNVKRPNFHWNKNGRFPVFDGIKFIFNDLRTMGHGQQVSQRVGIQFVFSSRFDRPSCLDTRKFPRVAVVLWKIRQRFRPGEITGQERNIAETNLWSIRVLNAGDPPVYVAL